jgi:DNA mismatch repair protein MutS
VLEKLHSSIQCRTLFATHYHELSELESTLPSLGCYHTHVETSGKRTLFTHKIVPGSVQRSYGIEVARMAGVPDDVVDRAFYLLRNNTSL